jgi:methanogenic corrinoid protein MtbC1
VDVSISCNVIKLRACGVSEVKDLLNELFGIVVDFEKDSVSGISVAKVESKWNVFAALEHV